MSIFPIEILNDWVPPLDITPEMVIHGQGADPQVISRRNPRLLDIAEEAIRIGTPLLDPFVWIKSSCVMESNHQKITLMDGYSFSGNGLIKHLSGAELVMACVFSTGHQFERVESEMWSRDAVLALALDGMGTIAVDQLAARTLAKIRNHYAHFPDLKIYRISPGGKKWPLEEGQSQIFEYLNPPGEKIRILSGGQMSPKKSISNVLGIGRKIQIDASMPCDGCSSKDDCRYRSRKLIDYD